VNTKGIISVLGVGPNLVTMTTDTGILEVRTTLGNRDIEAGVLIDLIGFLKADREDATISMTIGKQTVIILATGIVAAGVAIVVVIVD
jgi:hypothetical protein